MLGYLVGDGVTTSFDIGAVTVNWGALVLIAVLTVLLTVGTKLSSRVRMVITGVVVYFGYGRRHSLLGLRGATAPRPMDDVDPRATPR